MALILNGRLSTDYGVVIENKIIKGVAARATAQNQIPGTNRIIVEDLGYYLPRSLTFRFHVRTKSYETLSPIEKFKAWFGNEFSDIRVEDTLQPDYYWNCYKDGQSIEMTVDYENIYYGQVSLGYNGLAYLKSGETTFFKDVEHNDPFFSIHNPTPIEAYPIITLKFDENNNEDLYFKLLLTNNDVVKYITINETVEKNEDGNPISNISFLSIELDFEKKIVSKTYKENGAEKHSKMVYGDSSFDFFKLDTGTTEVKIQNGSILPTRMSIKPRWMTT